MHGRAPSPSTNRSPARRSAVASVAIYTVLITWSLVCLFPVYWLAITSLKPGDAIERGPSYLPFVDFEPTLDAWRFILLEPTNSLILRFANSAFVAITATLITIVLAGLAIYALTRFRYTIPVVALILATTAVILAAAALVTPESELQFLLGPLAAAALILAGRMGRRGPQLGNRDIVFGLLATRVLPPVVLVLPFYLMAGTIGLLDTPLVLILVYTATNLPVAIWLLQDVFGQRASEPEEAAMLDGASHLSIFFTISVPMARAGLVAASLLIFVLCWNEYLLAAYLTRGVAMTMPPYVGGQMSTNEAQTGYDVVEWARLSAASLLMFAPLLALSGLVMRVISRAALGSR